MKKGEGCQPSPFFIVPARQAWRARSGVPLAYEQRRHDTHDADADHIVGRGQRIILEHQRDDHRRQSAEDRVRDVVREGQPGEPHLRWKRVHQHVRYGANRADEEAGQGVQRQQQVGTCLLYTSPSPRDQRGSRMPSSA